MVKIAKRNWTDEELTILAKQLKEYRAFNIMGKRNEIVPCWAKKMTRADVNKFMKISVKDA